MNRRYAHFSDSERVDEFLFEQFLENIRLQPEDVVEKHGVGCEG